MPPARPGDRVEIAIERLGAQGDGIGQHGPAPEVQTLTAREFEVLVALSEGEQYKEIAARLGVSINTVRRHIMAIYVKLHVNSRLDAIGKLGRF